MNDRDAQQSEAALRLSIPLRQLQRAERCRRVPEWEMSGAVWHSDEVIRKLEQALFVRRVHAAKSAKLLRFVHAQLTCLYGDQFSPKGCRTSPWLRKFLSPA